MLHDILAIGSGALVGFVLGLIGGGGSILAVPLLVYVVGVRSAHVAIGTSSVAVALSVLSSLIGHARAGNVRWPCALVFAACGMVGASLGSTIGKSFDGQRLLTLFGILMIVVALLMLRKPKGGIKEFVPLTRKSATAIAPRLAAFGGRDRATCRFLRHRRRLSCRAGTCCRGRIALAGSDRIVAGLRIRVWTHNGGKLRAFRIHRLAVGRHVRIGLNLGEPVRRSARHTTGRSEENPVHRDHMQVDLAASALKMAIQQQHPQAGLIHHSDRGVQYASQDHRAVLSAAGITATR